MLSSTTDKLLVCGDANAPGTDVSVDSGFGGVLESFGLIQHVTLPTQGKNILDILACELSCNIFDVSVISSNLVSDHSLVVCSLKVGKPTIFKTFKHRNLKQLNIELFDDALLCSEIFTCPANSAESYSAQIETVVTKLLDKMAPIKISRKRITIGKKT